jgi:hypothetical protein
MQFLLLNIPFIVLILQNETTKKAVQCLILVPIILNDAIKTGGFMSRKIKMSPITNTL